MCGIHGLSILGRQMKQMLYNRMQDLNKIHELKESPQSGSLVALDMHYPG